MNHRINMWNVHNSYLIFLLILLLFVCNANRDPVLLVAGDYDLNVVITKDTKLFFSGTREKGNQVYLDIKENGTRLLLLEQGQETVLKSKQREVKYPCQIRILKNGSYFRFWIGAMTEWIRGPLGEWKGVYEPLENEIYAADHTSVEKGRFDVKEREWLKQTDRDVVRYGPEGSYYEQQVIPGAILEYNNTYYMYFMAGMAGNEEGSSRRTVGLAISDDLINWTVKPEPVLSYKDTPYDNIYVNGAVVTPDHKIALMFSAQQFPEWKGFMLAIADQPEGKFIPYNRNPVYKHPLAAHEFDLVDMKEHPVHYDGADYRYLFFYAGFTRGNKTGDKGYLLYSNDLINWVNRSDNPVFKPETEDSWDSRHVRPRSLTRIGAYWYLWYEGVAGGWTPPNSQSIIWSDVIGLARSQDFVHWEYHPRNPVLSGVGQSSSHCGHSWVGWPRMVIKENTGYVFFCGDQDGKVSTSYRTIHLDSLTDWESDIKN